MSQSSPQLDGCQGLAALWRNRSVERAEDDPGPGPHADPDPHSA
jgi:hypothetical protein